MRFQWHWWKDVFNWRWYWMYEYGGNNPAPYMIIGPCLITWSWKHREWNCYPTEIEFTWFPD